MNDLLGIPGPFDSNPPGYPLAPPFGGTRDCRASESRGGREAGDPGMGVGIRNRFEESGPGPPGPLSPSSLEPTSASGLELYESAEGPRRSMLGLGVR